MFTINDYQISFRKSHSLIIRKNRGHFDTICIIDGKHSEYIFRGVAYLHPKDTPNRITGKKVALTKALANMGATKLLRTEIWNAFWKWVESWKSRKHNFTEGEELAYCKICKAGEGELTTECCGRPMTEDERNRVYKVGDLDFINGKWIEKKKG